MEPQNSYGQQKDQKTESRQEKKSRKEKQNIDWRRQSQIKLHETKFYKKKQNKLHKKNKNGAEMKPGNTDT